MAFNRDKSHEVSSDGISMTDGPHIIGGSVGPVTALPSPIGPTVFVETNEGRLWSWFSNGPWFLETNFGYKLIEEDYGVVIRDNERAVMDGHITVRGHLAVRGDLIDISARTPERYFPANVPSSEVVAVWDNRVLFYKDGFSVQGHLRIIGEVSPV